MRSDGEINEKMVFRCFLLVRCATSRLRETTHVLVNHMVILFQYILGEGGGTVKVGGVLVWTFSIYYKIVENVSKH